METRAGRCAFEERNLTEAAMVSPLEIMPVLALALAIVLLPLAAERF
jgi:hypothetical protein